MALPRPCEPESVIVFPVLVLNALRVSIGMTIG
jgi:hypothetical protein